MANPGKPVSESRVTLSQLMGPADANSQGNVHGGVLMKLCDEAGAMAVIRHARRPVVTLAVDSMTFHSPVHIGNLVTFAGQVTWVGRTSAEARVVVTAENILTGQRTHTNTAYIVYVALDDSRQPTPIPPLLCTTAEEKASWERALLRRERRLAHKKEEEETLRKFDINNSLQH